MVVRLREECSLKVFVCTKSSQKLLFPSPCNAYVCICKYQRVKNVIFSEHSAYVLNKGSQRRLTIFDMDTYKNYNRVMVFTRTEAFHWPGALTTLFPEFWVTQIGHSLFQAWIHISEKCLIMTITGISQVKLIFSLGKKAISENGRRKICPEYFQRLWNHTLVVHLAGLQHYSLVLIFNFHQLPHYLVAI